MNFQLKTYNYFFVRKMIQSYCINYLVGSTFGVFIWIIESYGDNYLFIRTMEGNFKNDSELLNKLKKTV